MKSTPSVSENLSLHEMADAYLGHNWDAHGLHDLANLGRRRHARDAPFFADVRGNPLQGHYRNGAGLLSNLGLFCVSDVHDCAALEHVGETGFQSEFTGHRLFLHLDMKHQLTRRLQRVSGLLGHLPLDESRQSPNALFDLVRGHARDGQS